MTKQNTIRNADEIKVHILRSYFPPCCVARRSQSTTMLPSRTLPGEKSATKICTFISSAFLTLVLLSFMGFANGPIYLFLETSRALEILPTSNPSDSLLYIEKQQLSAKDSSTLAKTMTIAHSFLGAPYVNGCLDCYREEQLVVNLREMDCWTFVENSIAIALAKNGSYGFYQTYLQQLRYWGGRLDGYGSRIHYFTGWLLQAEQCGILDNISESMGGIPYKKTIGYMTARPSKYSKLKDKKILKQLQMAEKRINAHHWYFIPQNKIPKIEHLIQEGDIICLTSAKQDLDIAHQGFAVKQQGHIYLMHASSLSKKVIISRQPLAQYVASQRGQTGIMVARLK